MLTKKFLYTTSVGLSVWCLINVYGSFTVPNWYELLLGYLVLILPFAILLFAISFYNLKNNIIKPKIFSLACMIVGGVSVILPIVQIIYVIRVYY